MNDVEKRLDRLENLLIDLADNVMDDSITGNDLKGILIKHKVVVK